MKKIIAAGAIAVLVLLVLSACGGQKAEVSEEKEGVAHPVESSGDADIHPAPTVTTTQGPPATTLVQGNQAGNLAPDFKLNNLEGKTVSLSDFRGKPVLIDFWVTWCPHCQAERPLIQQIYDKRQSKDYILLTIDILGTRPTETTANLADFMRKNKYTFPVLLDTNREVTKSYGVKFTPTHFLIDKDGIIREVRTGPYPNEAAFEESFSQLLAK